LEDFRAASFFAGLRDAVFFLDLAINEFRARCLAPGERLIKNNSP
jgi:hypothetical protein